MADQNRNQSNQSSGQREQPSSQRTDDVRQTQGNGDDQSTGRGGSSRERTSREPASTADDLQRERRNMNSDESDSTLTRDTGFETENIESDLDSDIDSDDIDWDPGSSGSRGRDR
jgi:hypothetical protein